MFQFYKHFENFKGFFSVLVKENEKEKMNN